MKTHLEVAEQIKKNGNCNHIDCDNCPFNNCSGRDIFTHPINSSNDNKVVWDTKAEVILFNLKLKEGKMKKIMARMLTIEEITGKNYITGFETDDVVVDSENEGYAQDGERHTFIRLSSGRYTMEDDDSLNSVQLDWLKDIEEIKEENIITLSNGDKVSESTVLAGIAKLGKES